MKILRRTAVEEKTGLSRSTIYKYVSVGIFPHPISLGPRARGWLESDVDEWIQKRLHEAQ